MSGRRPGAVGPLLKQTIQALLFVSACALLYWLVAIYGSGLRDARYLDGWILAGGMALQLAFHIALKTARLAPKSAARWRRVHLVVGYLLIAVFVIHCDFTLPDTGFEWALWIGFVLVTLTGVLGTYLAWSLRVKGRIDDGVTYDRLPALRAALARDLREVVNETDTSAPMLALPGLPHEAWIAELYATRLRDFFGGPRNAFAHLIASQRPLKRLTDEIDNLSRFVDQQSKERLAIIRAMVLQKDRLDFARVFLGLNKGWLFIHVPVTYGLIVLTIVHILVVYSYASGAW